MEGSPARSQKLDGLVGLLVTLNDASTMADFTMRLLDGIARQLQHGQGILIGRNSESGELDIENLRCSEDSLPLSPTWLRSHLDRHPELSRKLKQGEMVGITHVEGSTTPQPASLQAIRRNVLLLPMIVEGELVGVIGLALPVEALQYSEDEVEFVRQLSHCVSPALARMEELEKLRCHYRENEALRAILEMQRHLQSNVAHELRTPLASVRGYTRMILDGRAGEIPQTQRDYLNVVTENANRLIGLINWMSRLLQYGTQHLNVMPADVKELWAACFKSQAPALSERSITVEQRIPQDPFVIPCDRLKIECVLTSLLTNAIRSSQPGGRIVVEFSRGRQREVSIKITDFGGGIPPDQLTKIFERYNSSAFPAANPTDLGLAGIYDIIGLHGGRLFVNSSPAEGSTFLFTLPAVRQESMERTG